MKKISKKIPGILLPPPKTEVDGKIVDLSNKTLTELVELKERQLKLLNNKNFILKLADKGAKIQAFYDKIITQLEIKQQEDSTCQLFERLKIEGIDKDTVQNLEWDGKVESKKDGYLDSDDDSEPEDVMHILSQSTSQEKKVKAVKTEKPLITPEDLINIEEIPHVKYIVDKTETNKPTPKPTGNFKPYKTTKTDVHNPEKEVVRIKKLTKKHKNWEITAATPPPILHGPAKILGLEESLKLQKDYNLHIKEIEAQHAASKLLLRAGIKMADLPSDTRQFGSYRNVDTDDSDASDPEGSDKEVHDEEQERGGVVFTVMK